MNPVNLVNVEKPVFGLRDPDERGYFGAYGGRFVPETLVAPIEELTRGYLTARADAAFGDELSNLLRHYVGRPTPLYETRRLATVARGGASRVRILLKREDLTHTGAHKINNALGQALLAARDGEDAQSSRKPAPVSTALRRRPPAPCSALSASSTWARSTCVARSRTWSACGCSAPKSAASMRQQDAEGCHQRGDA